jgi:transcriptional regulator with XRE-family HTH domain
LRIPAGSRNFEAERELESCGAMSKTKRLALPPTRTGARPRGGTPEQLAAMADYHRARRGFANDAGLADALGVHRTRLAAWKRGEVAPNSENARVLSHLSVVVRELEEFLDPDVIRDWLLTEQLTLGGRTPAEALRDGRLAEVLYTANATEHGAFV